MTLALYGIGVSRGFAIGKVTVLQRNQPEITEYALPADLIDEEIDRLRQALATAKAQLIDIRDRISASMPDEVTEFINTHLMMLDDSPLSEAPIRLIREQHCNAEWALQLQHDWMVKIFDEMDDPYLRSRRDDIDHVVRRVQRILLADESPYHDLHSHRFEDRVVVADDLTPADTVLLQHQGVAAFVTDYGGPLSHTAILARSLRIPAIVGIRHARRYLRQDETVIVDGEQGTVLADSDRLVFDYYRGKQIADERRYRALSRISKQPAITRDQVAIRLYANIELPEDANDAVKMDACGIGLYRTEFLFMNRGDTPDEEEHLSSYLHVIRALGDSVITIRTVDLGADKQIGGSRLPSLLETPTRPVNPALGLRAIRLCLKEPELIRPQLRAIFRASAHGNIRMMIPMLSNTQELNQFLRLIEDVKRELRNQHIAFNEKLPIGGMIEVPAAAVCASYFARQLSFLSIGTNDLIQYALAIDRIDDEVNYLYDPLHPAVLRLIQMTLRAGQRAGIPVSLCGEMAGDPRYTRLLLGLGLTEFSMHPASLLEVKQVIKDSDTTELTGLVRRILNTSDSDRLAGLLERITGYR